MASKILIAFMALLVVAMAFEFEDDFADDFDVDFLKRDPSTHDLWLADKRGKSMKKYRQCATMANCWCNKRGGKIAFCKGAGGDSI